ncbi:uncharacterized protein PSANT_04563 [Moesziomyces antarcticus]|uniref:BRCT domain-containing protein n=1 Tax=Pseudozyma antarctica TaxID=84753 RepID=A0A5C3FTK5_PSEA2|nr:uncharacterized protein PSANT_04563 [Moesziomyces antarcticus]
MSSTSPQKRRSNAFRTSLIEQPVRQTRSMARISDVLDATQHFSMAKSDTQRPSDASMQSRASSPRKARASQAAQLDHFDPESPDVSLAACMESPKKGRFDDFEFELENSKHELPVRRTRANAQRQSASSSSADASLPRSKTSTTLNRTMPANPLHASRKENSTVTVRDPVQPGASPVKPAATAVRPSRLHGHAAAAQSSNLDGTGTADVPTTSAAVKGQLDTKVDSMPHSNDRDSNQRLLFGTARASSRDPAHLNPFSTSSDTNSLAQLGEPRHSPVKRFQTKSEFVIQSPDRPDRKPINLLELKPSPGKAQRGIFRHNSVVDDEDDDDWGTSDNSELNITMDEIKLVKGPSVPKQAATRSHEVSTSSRAKADASASSKSKDTTHKMASTISTLDVRDTMSPETSDMLANLEASLVKLRAKAHTQPVAVDTKKKEEQNVPAPVKRELGGLRASGVPASRTQTFRIKSSTTSADLAHQARSATDQSGDSSVFKRPSGRVSALAKSRVSSSEHGSDSSLTSSRSMMSFGAPRLPGFSEVGGRASRPMPPSARTSNLGTTSDDSRNEELAAAEEEQERIAEAKRQAELKAAKRKSMSSILSSGMPPTLQRREASASSSGSQPPQESSAKPTSPTAAKPSEDSAEAKKAAKAARRRSLFTYVPTKREDTDGDRSVGNLSTGLVISTTPSGNASEADTSTQAPRKARFLRGLTVLVDVRDQDGEDASGRWVEMLKNAGAKVMLRFPERKLTHIVYKSGRPSTLHSYRALDDPKPHVVGISWVVACLEQGKKADERPYLVEVAKEAIFANPRRSSMAPKNVPSSATSIREQMQKSVEQARRKLLAHAPAVSSPLRRRISSRSVLARQLAATSIHSDTADTASEAARPRASSSRSSNETAENADAVGQGLCSSRDDDGDGDLDELAQYRETVKQILSKPTGAFS